MNQFLNFCIIKARYIFVFIKSSLYSIIWNFICKSSYDLQTDTYYRFEMWTSFISNNKIHMYAECHKHIFLLYRIIMNLHG